ncbi:MAG: deoxyribodipyrimidine photolyase [Rhodopirellula sp.]|nr:deoxyribodipyrimidine photolyase [Rhodopirellula sp.]
MSCVPEIRIRRLNEQPVANDGDFVLYWMISSRRATSNFALQRAIEWSAKLRKPLLILEALRVGYEWASDRFHRFVLQGMSDNRAAFADKPVRYYPYVEPDPGAGSGLVQELAKLACVVVTDDFPCFFIPEMLARTASRLSARLEAVDSNGLLPMRAAPTVFPTAYAFRRFLQRELAPHLDDLPEPDPFFDATFPRPLPIDSAILAKWPEATDQLLAAGQAVLSTFPIDHAVGPAALRGGSSAADPALQSFLDEKLHRYQEDRSQPEADVASGLSPWLHFGHISATDVFAQLAMRENWNPGKLADTVKGSRQGWWGMSEPAESFLDELITWRELGYNFCWQREDYDQYESLPDWAQATLEEHAADSRPHVYSLDEFETARTHDELWNAAQTQLVREGRMHNYLRMLWGKKILHWSESPREAMRIMIHLNNKYAVDGRNPNSYSGIFWVLGRYDRAWGPERPVFGKIRYMTSENTARKFKVKDYIRKYSRPQSSQLELW